MRSFTTTIQDLDIIDLPLLGAYYTWFRGAESMQASRIDRFLISHEWDENFNAIKQLALPRVVSDHRPLLLECGNWEANPSYFKFENMWLQVEGFTDNIKSWWQSYSIGGSPYFIPMQKLRRLKKDITEWNRETFGKLAAQQNKLLEDLSLLEQVAENRPMIWAEKEKSLHL